MPDIIRSALLPYSADAMYQIVNDVSTYPDYLPWCGGVEIHHQDSNSMEASILMKKGRLNHWFRTCNELSPGRSIDIRLLEGPFSALNGCWRFLPFDSSGCKIELNLHFEMKRGVVSVVIAPLFTQIANTMVDSFCRRAEALYG